MVITVKRGVDAYMAYHKANSRPNSIRSFGYTLSRFRERFGDLDIAKVPESEIVEFLDEMTEGLAQATKNGRAMHLSAMFNFCSETFDLDFRNPCSRGIVKKLYKRPKFQAREMIDKEIIDEVIYNARGANRLILELQGRGGMRIGEVLQIRPRNLNMETSTVAIEQPKSGRSGEMVYLPSKLMRRLDDYVREKRISDNKRIFSVSYTTARRMVVAAGKKAGITLKPHDLRRHAATRASRAGTPIEYVSKVILRHANLATTQIYLGTVSPAEARRVMDNLYG